MIDQPERMSKDSAPADPLPLADGDWTRKIIAGRRGSVLGASRQCLHLEHDAR